MAATVVTRTVAEMAADGKLTLREYLDLRARSNSNWREWQKMPLADVEAALALHRRQLAETQARQASYVRPSYAPAGRQTREEVTNESNIRIHQTAIALLRFIRAMKQHGKELPR